MKKTKLFVAVGALAALVAGLTLTACDEKGEQGEPGSDGHVHALTHVAAVEATCTEPGSLEYWTCSDCGKKFADEEATEELSSIVLPAKGHTPGEAATCTEPQFCTVCNAAIGRETAETDELGHDIVKHEAKAATCTEIGWNAYETCSRCDYTTYEEIAATGHNYVEGVCSVCGAIEGLSLTLSEDGSCYSVTGYRGSAATLNIPSVYNGLPVTSIGDYAFSECSNLTSINIPNSVTSIGDSVFSWCSNLDSISIPNSVTSIGDSVFSWCSNLTSVTIGNGVTSIGEYAFYFCANLTTVYYNGTEEEWNSIDIGRDNSNLTDATIYFKGEW